MPEMFQDYLTKKNLSDLENQQAFELWSKKVAEEQRIKDEDRKRESQGEGTKAVANIGGRLLDAYLTGGLGSLGGAVAGTATGSDYMDLGNMGKIAQGTPNYGPDLSLDGISTYGRAKANTGKYTMANLPRIK